MLCRSGIKSKVAKYFLYFLIDVLCCNAFFFCVCNVFVVICTIAFVYVNCNKFRLNNYVVPGFLHNYPVAVAKTLLSADSDYVCFLVVKASHLNLDVTTFP